MRGPALWPGTGVLQHPGRQPRGAERGRQVLHQEDQEVQSH